MVLAISLTAFVVAVGAAAYTALLSRQLRARQSETLAEFTAVEERSDEVSRSLEATMAANAGETDRAAAKHNEQIQALRAESEILAKGLRAEMAAASEQTSELMAELLRRHLASVRIDAMAIAAEAREDSTS
jgi:hypothetical protein